MNGRNTYTGPESLLTNSSTNASGIEFKNAQGTLADVQKDLADTKDKLKIVTQKFANTRKERDQFKTDNAELQDEIIQLQQSMR